MVVNLQMQIRSAGEPCLFVGSDNIFTFILFSLFMVHKPFASGVTFI